MLLDCRLPGGVKLTAKEAIERTKRRQVYKTEFGIEELVSLVNLTNVFHVISGPEEIILHNMGIQKLESLGLLDEENLRPLLKYMLNHPSLKETNAMVIHEQGEERI